MKKFLLTVCIVLFAISILAACAPLQNIVGDDVIEYTQTLPRWAIIVGSIVLFSIGFGIIWRLIPGFIKFIALIVLAVAIAAIALGLWHIPIVDQAKDAIEDAKITVESLIE